MVVNMVVRNRAVRAAFLVTVTVLVAAVTCFGGVVPAEADTWCPAVNEVYRCEPIDGSVNEHGWVHGDWTSSWKVSVTESQVTTRKHGSGTRCLAVQDGPKDSAGSHWQETTVSVDGICKASAEGSPAKRDDYVEFTHL